MAGRELTLGLLAQIWGTVPLSVVLLCLTLIRAGVSRGEAMGWVPGSLHGEGLPFFPQEAAVRLYVLAEDALYAGRRTAEPRERISHARRSGAPI